MTIKDIMIDEESIESLVEKIEDKQDGYTLKRRWKDLWDTLMHLQLIDETHALVDEDEVDGSCLEGEKECEWDCSIKIDI
jgi:hypothetical protein